MLYASRSEALGFGQRARANLRHIEEARRCGSDVHEVTQIGLSLLGLVVFRGSSSFYAASRRNAWKSCTSKGGNAGTLSSEQQRD